MTEAWTPDASASLFEVDLATLQSDEARRDNYLRGNTLRTDRFPTAAFRLVQVRGLATAPGPGSGQLQLVGDLTLRGVTREVVWEVDYTASEEEVSGTAVTSFAFEDFGLSRPQVALVLSVEETIRLQLDFLLRLDPAVAT